jgi:hypothetical protein
MLAVYVRDLNIGLTKWRRMRVTETFTFGVEERCNTKFWWGNPKKRYNFEDLNIVGGRIILKWIFSK